MVGISILYVCLDVLIILTVLNKNVKKNFLPVFVLW